MLHFQSAFAKANKANTNKAIPEIPAADDKSPIRIPLALAAAYKQSLIDAGVFAGGEPWIPSGIRALLVDKAKPYTFEAQLSSGEVVFAAARKTTDDGKVRRFAKLECEIAAPDGTTHEGGQVLAPNDLDSIEEEQVFTITYTWSEDRKDWNASANF